MVGAQSETGSSAFGVSGHRVSRRKQANAERSRSGTGVARRQADDGLSIDTEIVAAVVGCGYEYVPEYEGQFPQRRYFRRSEHGRRTHQVHLVERSNIDWWDRHVSFRVWLRSNPLDRDAYAQLKRDLAAAHRNDRVGYTDAKSEFIAAIVSKSQ